MQVREQIIERVRSFLSQSGMSARRFGVEAVGDSKFVSRLHGGAGITLTTLEKAEAFIAAHPSCPAPPNDFIGEGGK